MSDETQITKLLAAWSGGDESSPERLMPLVEAELRRIAHRYMRREKGNHTLQTTALVNEAYLKLINQKEKTWQNRSHFFALICSRFALTVCAMIGDLRTSKRN